MRLFELLNRAVVIAALGGLLIGVIAVLAAEQVDRYTSTDAFCGTACHSMQAYIATEETYVQSPHRTTASGVRAGCGDCHISKAGIIPATWDHIKGGIKDIFVEATNDFSKPEVWEARRAKLAYSVRDKMLANDSANCRVCHEEDAIKPEKKRGQKQHADAVEQGLTCIGCHYNLVHREVDPRDSFLDEAEQGKKRQ
ncbi:MAG: NapC/NirT family cytochrome c [Acidiferrobacterales bacterium]